MCSRSDDMTANPNLTLPVALSCRCNKNGLKLLIASAKLLSRGTNVIQLFDKDEDLLARFLPAYFNALMRAKDRRMRAKTLQMEFLLLVAKTMKLDRALERHGAKGNEFLLFASSQRLAKRFVAANKVEVKKWHALQFKPEVAEGIALAELREG